MTATLIHRGPDERGFWLDREAGIALGQRRLALTKGVSPLHPMTSLSGRYAIAFDGTIYNHMALRQRLATEGYTQWRGTTDTETLLAAFSCWGIRRALQACSGLFAIALWDSKTRRLTLVRDRMGEKPLYYGWMGQHFLFGSELKALQAHPEWNATINREAIASQLRLSYIPAPQTIYQQIFKLESGHLLQITPRILPGSQLQSEAWWSLATPVMQTTPIRCSRRFFSNAPAQIAALETLLKGIIGEQMLTNAPLGVFLTGTVEASLVAALMQVQTHHPVKTFSIGYETAGFPVTSYTREVARHLGTKHTEFITSPVDVLDLIPQLPTLFDEPLSDISQIPALLMAQLAKTNVTISLTSNGADELFSGHHRYGYAQQLWQRLQYLPSFLRSGLARTLSRFDAQRWNKASEILSARSPEDIYRYLLAHWKNPEEIVLGIHSVPDMLPASLPARLNFAEKMLYMDAMGYLPDNRLTITDRTSMGSGLETRSPFLDERMVEFAWQLPLRMKIRNGQGKWLLQQALERHIPLQRLEHAPHNPKMPLGHWLRTNLREWAETLLNPLRLRQEGFFDPFPIQEKWQQHLAGTHDWQHYLWDVLMFQAWHEQQTPLIRTLAA